MENLVGWYVGIASDGRGFVVACGCTELECLCTLPSTGFFSRHQTQCPDTHMHARIHIRMQQIVTKLTNRRGNTIHVGISFFFYNSAPVLAFCGQNCWKQEQKYTYFKHVLVWWHLDSSGSIFFSATGSTWNAWWSWPAWICWREG